MNMEYSLVDVDSLIHANLHLVGHVVRRMTPHVPTYLNQDEMAAAARLGLVEAARRFEPSLGVKFNTFAEQRMRGAILDAARRLDWASRPAREKHRRVAATFSRLAACLGRDPEETEMAQELGLDVEAYRDLLTQVGCLGCVSLFEPIGDEGSDLTLLDTLSDERQGDALDQILARENVARVAEIIKTLTEREQQVVALLYYEEISQKEIAEVLSITEGRVSQLHSSAMTKLRAKLSRAPELLP